MFYLPHPVFQQSVTLIAWRWLRNQTVFLRRCVCVRFFFFPFSHSDAFRASLQLQTHCLCLFLASFSVVFPQYALPFVQKKTPKQTNSHSIVESSASLAHGDDFRQTHMIKSTWERVQQVTYCCLLVRFPNLPLKNVNTWLYLKEAMCNNQKMLIVWQQFGSISRLVLGSSHKKRNALL